MLLNKKTPTKYSGLKPDSYNFEEKFYGWSKSEQLEFLEYFERDTTRFSAIMGLLYGLGAGIVVVIIILTLIGK